MDSERFDRVAKMLAQAGTRRRVVRLLAVLPMAGALSVLLGDDTAAKGRRKRRTKRNKRHSGKDKDNRTGKRKGKRKDRNRGTPASDSGSPAPTGCTCPSGCCAANGSCQPGTSDTACGTGGGSCIPCTDDQWCTSGTCVATLPFGTACTSNGACASGICACIARDCSGGGLCGNAWIQGVCITGGATVATPDGGVSTVCIFGRHPSLWTACGTCTGLEICQIDQNRDICLTLNDM